MPSASIFCAMPDSLRIGELGIISARLEIFIVLNVFCLLYLKCEDTTNRGLNTHGLRTFL